MKNPDFTSLKPDFSVKPQIEPKLEQSWKTNEQLDVKPLYTKADLEGLERSGLIPFRFTAAFS
jgi:hypothetical protein